MRLTSRSVASLARALGPSRLGLVSSHGHGPLLDIFLRQPLIRSLTTASQASSAPNYKSKFVGVAWHRPNKTWQAQIGIGGKMQYFGRFDNEDDAARAFDERAAPLDRPVSFPGPGQALSAKRGAHGIVPLYTGVCWNTRNEKWQSEILIIGSGDHAGGGFAALALAWLQHGLHCLARWPNDNPAVEMDAREKRRRLAAELDWRARRAKREQREG